MSAIIHAMAWWRAMGLPIWTRCLAYWMDSSRAAWRMPTPCAAMPTRPWSKAVPALTMPAPSAPSRFSFGTRQSLKTTSEVCEERRPILWKCSPGFNPGVPLGMMKELIPLRPAALSVQQKTRYVSASGPLEMKVFVPLRT
ncbi:MAG: hypothetical protein A4E67_02384 [Syntrophaceae bacterium PtaB.Bin038]|nr:MAG: hypothetical protein A4E67_02384 [Syntrophaceae bacterium PtaB.Bin038]